SPRDNTETLTHGIWEVGPSKTNLILPSEGAACMTTTTIVITSQVSSCEGLRILAYRPMEQAYIQGLKLLALHKFPSVLPAIASMWQVPGIQEVSPGKV